VWVYFTLSTPPQNDNGNAIISKISASVKQSICSGLWVEAIAPRKIRFNN
jgi:hypothetical protein